MRISRDLRIHGLLSIFLVVALSTGCGTSRSSVVKEPGKFPPHHVRLGPLLQLSDRRVVKAAGAMDNTGRTHLLVAMKSPKEIEYIVIDADNHIQRERLARFDVSTFFGMASDLKLDIAIDAKGRLRAIVEDNAMIRDEGTWKPSGKTPCLKYVRAGETFNCVFLSPGKEVGGSSQFDLFGFGGYPGAAIIFPWVSYPHKLVIRREEGEKTGTMAVIEPGLRGIVDARGFASAGDSGGTVHLVYSKRMDSFLVSSTDSRYVRIPPAMDCDRKDPKKEAAVDNSGLSRCYGVDVPVNLKADKLGFAADPDGESGILVVYGTYEGQFTPLLYSRRMRDGKFGPPKHIPLKDAGYPQVASAGHGDFHFIAFDKSLWNPSYLVFYLSYEGDSWSSPVELGNGIHPYETFLLVSDASRRAFAVWPTEKGMEGRWVELVK